MQKREPGNTFPRTPLEYSEDKSIENMWKLIMSLALLGVLGGCSATTLRCGITEDTSYVDLTNVPQDLSGQARYFTDLCGFAYEKGDKREATIDE